MGEETGDTREESGDRREERGEMREERGDKKEVRGEGIEERWRWERREVGEERNGGDMREDIYETGERR